MLEDFKSKIKNNTKVIENYFFMTLLLLFNSGFQIIIYPFIIRRLGADVLGKYIFAISITYYFIAIIGFGFDILPTKKIAENQDNIEEKSKILSFIFSSKIYLFIVSSIIYFTLIISIPFLRENKLLHFNVFINTLNVLFFNQWYFQGMQKMRIQTYIQICLKIISLPFIFLFVKESHDIIIYAIIMSLSSAIGGLLSFLQIIIIDKIRFKLMHIKNILLVLKENMPFFWAIVIGTIRQEAIVLLTGIFLSMRDVAIYDLANKIIVAIRIIVININSALFPKIMKNLDRENIKKIIKYEYILSFSIIGLIILFGKYVVIFLGGKDMIAAYPISIILSFSIVSWLIVYVYLFFIFTPSNNTRFIPKSQLLVCICFFIFVFIGFYFYKSIYVLVLSSALACLIEIIYCRFIAKKYKLM